MNSQAAATIVELEERQFVREIVPETSEEAERTVGLCVLDCPDSFYYTCSERAERDRQASLAFLHHLVMGQMHV